MNAFILQWWTQAKRLMRDWTRVAVRSTHWVAGGGGTLLSHWRAAQRRPDYVIELIPPRAERDNALDTLALDNLFQSLLLTAREPIALEIYGALHERRLLPERRRCEASSICAPNSARMRRRSRCGRCLLRLLRQFNTRQLI